LDATSANHAIAKKLVEKWQNKNCASKSTKAKSSAIDNKDAIERKSAPKRKSLGDHVTPSSTSRLDL